MLQNPPLEQLSSEVPNLFQTRRNGFKSQIALKQQRQPDQSKVER